jgi:glutamate/tyrosine decarboxylase-like PLP-dependent enzyme
MRAPELDRLLTLSRENGAVPLMVAATSGTTVRGSFDELPLLAEICGRHKVWLHADAAWGGPALFSSKLRHLVQGIDFADSVTFDAHKLFGASVTSSFFLTRHERILLEANDVAGGDYLFHAADPNLDRGRLSWQCGRGADAFSFWTIWKSLGTEGLGVFVERLISIREESTAWIEEQPRLELIGEPDYLNLCVRVRPPVGVVNKDWSRVVREQLKNENRAMVNFSANAEGSFLRLILAHPYLTFAHVQQILTWALEVNA